MQGLRVVGSGTGQLEGAAGDRTQMALGLNALQSQVGDIRPYSAIPGSLYWVFSGRMAGAEGRRVD